MATTSFEPIYRIDVSNLNEAVIAAARDHRIPQQQGTHSPLDQLLDQVQQALDTKQLTGILKLTDSLATETLSIIGRLALRSDPYRAAVGNFFKIEEGLMRSFDALGALFIGAVPEQAESFFKAHVETFDFRTRHASLQTMRNKFQRYARDQEFAPDDPITYWLAANALGQPEVIISPSLFLLQVHAFKKLCENPTERASIAREELFRFTSVVKSTEEFGPDIPFAKYRGRENAAADYASLSALLQGHKLIVLFDDFHNAYRIVTDRSVTGIGPLDCFHKRGLGTHHRWASKAELESSKTILMDRKDVLLALPAIRRLYAPLSPVEGRTRTKLDFYDPVTPDSANTFFAVSDSAHVAIRGVANVVVKPFSLSKQVKVAEGKYADLSFYLTPVSVNGQVDLIDGAPKTSPIPLIMCFHTAVSRLEKVRERLGPQEARLVQWSNNQWTLHLKNGFPSSLLRDAYPASQRFQLPPHIYTLQNFFGSNYCAPIFGPCNLFDRDDRFDRSPLSLSFDTIKDLPLNKTLTRLQLLYAYDPKIASLGFSSDDRGNNCLTDGRLHSIPLSKPTKEQFDLVELEPIRGLRHVPRRYWQQFLSAIEGNRIDDMIDAFRAQDSSDEEDRDAPQRSEITSAAPLAQKECYRGERDAITTVGHWLIYHARNEKGPVFVVECPLYGNAAWVFRSLDGAEAAANKLVKADESRANSIHLIPGFVKRVIHSMHFQANLTDVIATA